MWKRTSSIFHTALAANFAKKSRNNKNPLTLIGMMRQGTFLFGSDFVSWIFTKNFHTFLEVKIDINRINLTVGTDELIESLKKSP